MRTVLVRAPAALNLPAIFTRSPRTPSPILSPTRVTMAAEVMQQARLERMSGEDFETASIRSAAPSYGMSS